MSTAKLHIYHHPGIFIPNGERGDDGEEWPRNPKEAAHAKGFLFVNSLKFEKVSAVQSVNSGQVLINKVVKGTTIEINGQDREVIPPEFRFSTAPQAEVQLPGPRINIDRSETPLFNELVYWRQYRDVDPGPVYSLFFKHCNGGTIEELTIKYHEARRKVPDHFIWIVAERLAEALVYFNFGIRPGEDTAPNNWALISHRDLASNNTFIHYKNKKGGTLPVAGNENAAFPDIVIGDFGEASMLGDPKEMITYGIFGTDRVRAWEDMIQCWMYAPSAIANTNLPPNETPYPDDLIELLEAFEWPGLENGMGIQDTHDDANGNPVRNYRVMPTPNWIRNTMLPLCRDKVQEWRGAGRRPRGYFTALDVSWTKPARIMPMEVELPEPPAPVMPYDILFLQNEHTCPQTQTEKNWNGVRTLRKWHYVRPEFQIVELQWHAPKHYARNADPAPPPLPPPIDGPPPPPRPPQEGGSDNDDSDNDGDDDNDGGDDDGGYDDDGDDNNDNTNNDNTNNDNTNNSYTNDGGDDNDDGYDDDDGIE
ncbi:hypothetical protein F5Y04DRAFT_292100 [Hypomontagnella monticulosa]|nr:hypothetical protein F5Y04DRAFT_292100 [Hypomontagnella monticulosa]